MVWFGPLACTCLCTRKICLVLLLTPLGPLGFPRFACGVFFPHSLLILVYGFLTAIGEDYEGGIDGDVWPGSAIVGAIMLIGVILLMSESWIRGKCCPPKQLQYGARKAR